VLVVGPIQAEQVPPHLDPPSGNAGAALRAAIEAALQADTRLSLVEAPSEGLSGDAPRPDLARKGIRYVVKGNVNYQQETSEVRVFLRAVDTGSGKIVDVASARGQDPLQVSREAARGLAGKLGGRLTGGAG
jgi:hypothetical protein